MKSIILLGAYDRYNFGDNLMPIVFRMFLEAHYPEVANSYKLVNAALFRSDLSRYGCPPTIPLSEAVETADSGSVVVVVGGETISSRALTLYSHTVHNPQVAKLIKLFARFGGRIASVVGARICRTGFEFPFTPSAAVLGKDLQVAFSSVGGVVPKDGWRRNILLERLSAADYVSVRDFRSSGGLANTEVKYYVAPDSVSAISALIDETFLNKRVSDSVRSALPNDYFVFQAAPHKIKSSVENVVGNLKRTSEKHGIPFILLPIGYASGHDDRDYLRSISKFTDFPLLDDLNIWEILTTLKYTRAYFGTSLHGAIAAMAFKRAHFGIGNVPKLNEYLSAWSEPPFTGNNSIGQISNLADLAIKDNSDILARIAENTSAGALENLHRLVRVLD